MARTRDALLKRAQFKTGGGMLSDKEKRIAESNLYSDVATRMGISASGNVPRFDSDSVSSNDVLAPTRRLRRVQSMSERRVSFAVDVEQLVIASDEDFEMTEPMTLSSSASLSQPLQQPMPQPSTSSQQPMPQTSTSQPSTSRPTTLQSSASRTTAKKKGTRRPSTSIRTDNKRAKNDIRSENLLLLNEHIKQQQEINELQKEYLEIQINRSRVALEREKLSLRVTELELQKAEELKNIEIDKQRRLADLDIAARQRQLNM